MSLPEELNAAFVPSDPIGTVRRVIHLRKTDGSVCSEGKDACLSVQRIHDGWVYRCFRCNLRGKTELDGVSPKEVIRMYGPLPAPPQLGKPSVFIPEDAVPIILGEEPRCSKHTNVPIRALQWLLEYRINFKKMIDYNLVYSPSYQRIIFPIYNSAHFNSYIHSKSLVGWVGRGEPFDGVKPLKENKSPKWLIKKYNIKSLVYHLPAKNDVFVIVEDVVSAIRVHEATGYNAVALLGTWLSLDLLMLKLKDTRVKIWLDYDARIKSLEYWRKCMSLGVKCDFINSPLDPKRYSDDYIFDKVGV